MAETLKVLRTDQEIDGLIDYLSNPELDIVAYDCETTGLSLDAEVVGLSVAADTELGFYVVTAAWDKEKKELIRLPNRTKVIHLLSLLLSKRLVMHNGLVDVN